MWRELRKGSSGLLLLHFLTECPMYGFELAERLESGTAGVLDLKEGTLYPALHRLELRTHGVEELAGEALDWPAEWVWYGGACDMSWAIRSHEQDGPGVYPT